MTKVKKRDRALAVAAPRVVQKATKERELETEVKTRGKNPHAVALGRLGGLKGGKARATKMTASQRSEIARRAAISRWHNVNASRKGEK
jgi:hypothetical protein